MFMSMRMAFPRAGAGAGFSAKRHRYDELAVTFKVVKEEVEKERREKRKEWWRHNNKWNNKKSEGAKYSPTWKKRRHLEWEQKYDHDYYYYYRSSASFNSSERRRRRQRRRDEDEHESKPFERRSCSLMSSWEKKKVPALPVPIATTSAYANKTKTKKGEEELSSSSETSTSSSSCGINICGVNDEETTNKRSSWCMEKEELEYKKLELELQKMVPFNDAASLPPLDLPLDLDWLYPKTSTKKDEGRGGRAEKGRQQRKISLSLSPSDADQINRSLSLGPHAQYLHELHIFALPYALPF